MRRPPRSLALLIVAVLVAVLALGTLPESCDGASVPSVIACPNKCSNNGVCEKNVCQCRPGYSGPDCSQVCPSLCSGPEQGACVAGKCACRPGYTGKDCSTVLQCPRSTTDHPELDCAGHGICDRASQTCVCRAGYAGEDCSIDDGSCGALHCSNHGHCESGKCTCDLSYTGEHCETKASCPKDCSAHGACIDGACKCFPGFTGADCSTRDGQSCPGPNGSCNGNGVCITGGKCVCSVGFTGDACEKLIAPDAQPFCAGNNTCSDHGVCAHNQCFCAPGYYGPKCEHTGCADGCSKHGYCSVGRCRCEPGYGGPDCSKRTECPQDCSQHGICVKGQCSCEAYYTGADCSELTLPPLPCPKNKRGRECNGRGKCFLGQCFCEPSFAGKDCSETVDNCPGNCSGAKGTCRFGKCFCEAGYEGADCSIETKCPTGCEQHGLCLKGVCKCALGWTGKDCQKKMTTDARQSALEKDLLNAVLIKPTPEPPIVLPKKNQTLDAKAFAPIPVTPTVRSNCGAIRKPCAAHGLCVGSGATATCVCAAGFGGDDCSIAFKTAAATPCLKPCMNGGECAFGTCLCPAGFTGPTCEEPVFEACPSDCSGRGICFRGQCECHPGFVGEDCSRVQDCSRHGGCVHGVCVQGVCTCVHGFKGGNCTEPITAADTVNTRVKEYLHPSGDSPCGLDGCGAHGVCLAHQCVCVEGYAGLLCDVPALDYVPTPAGKGTRANPLVADIYGAQNCTVDCGLHGVCVGGACTCVDGWAGETCIIAVPTVLPKETETYAAEGAAHQDFLAMMTTPAKRPTLTSQSTTAGSKAAAAGTTTPAKKSTTEAAAVKALKVALLESESIVVAAEEETLVEPVLHRQTALISPTPQLFAPAIEEANTDEEELDSDASHMEMSTHLGSSSAYAVSLNPYLLTALWFTIGLLLTLGVKFLLDKRGEQARRRKKIQDLLQPAS